MRKTIDLSKEDNALPEAPWVHISIASENMETFKLFCERNCISFEVIDSYEDDTIYSVRDGLDAQDVISYMLRNTFKQGDTETAAFIHMLLQLRTGSFPQYEYELHAYRTDADDEMLSHFDYPPALEL